MNERYNVSSGPHTRSRLTTGNVMRDIVISLMPATIIGVWHFGFHAFTVIALAILFAVMTEYVFDLICKRGDTWKDGSAVVTGLLLALTLPPSAPLYTPALGSIFAILIVKCFFGGLGKNFMNPALAARCFLLLSFGSQMTNYSYPDAVTSATPLAELAAERTVNISNMFLGNGEATGVIGCAAFGLLLGAFYLLAVDAISWEIPASFLGVFVLFIGIFGGHGFEPMYIIAHLLGGGVIMGAFFMATDPVTSPVSSLGMLVYGGFIGLLAGVFRIFATATDSVSYAIIIGNLLTPMIDEYIVALPFGLRKGAQNTKSAGSKLSARMFLPALRLTIITLLAGIGLAGVYNMTKDTIEEQKNAKRLESYQAVLPEAAELDYDDDVKAIVDGMSGQVYGSEFGKVFINDVVLGKDASGNPVGYVVSATSGDGFDGNISLSVGVDTEGTIQGVEFTELNETAGMGMRCAEPEFKGQFSGRNVEKFTLNKAGGSTADDEIDSVSGASISSGAVVNAVNASLDFLQANVM